MVGEKRRSPNFVPFYPCNNSYRFIRAPRKRRKKFPATTFRATLSATCRVGRCERCEVECESGGAESRETKAKIGSRVLKLRPLCRVGERRRIHGCFPAARWKRKGREEEKRWTDRCLEAILVSSSVPCAFRISASKVERVLCCAHTGGKRGIQRILQNS